MNEQITNNKKPGVFSTPNRAGRARTRLYGVASAFLATAAVLAASVLQPAHAEYPEKPIRLIHAFAPGSSTDTAGRLIAERLTQRMGQPVVVENKPGANMIIGTNQAANAPADGYTMLVVTLDSMAINPAIQPSLSYSPKDFDGVALIGHFPLVVLGAKNLPYNDLGELIQDARANNKTLSFGTWGDGSVAHLVGAMLGEDANISFNFIPFGGAMPALSALMGEHIDLSIASAISAKDFVETGRAKALAFGGVKRSELLPDTPTFAELGLNNVNGTQWHAVSVRAGGNQDIINKLHKEISAIYQEPESRAKLLGLGYESIGGMTPEEFTAFMDKEAKTWAQAAKLIRN